MSHNHLTVTSGLLPLPRKLSEVPGTCPVGPDIRLELRVDDARLERAALRWRAGLCTDARQRPAVLRVAVDQSTTTHPQSYRLEIRPDRIELVGGTPAGCFHGLQTLTQLCSLRPGGVPFCTVVDHPDFATRGLLHDITRGKVPTLETLECLVDRLAAMKLNQLQLYIEHAFVFPFDDQICQPDDGLTPEEVRKLDEYCRERFIDLVPALATFGHMGRILSMPTYRHLAEVEATKTWREMTWPQRARGLTLDCTNPDAHRLVARMWSDVLDAFSSPVVNICGDEPWDLGKGKNLERFARSGIGHPYIEHMRRTHAVCAARGRRTQLWSDVLLNHPDLLDRLPSESTVLHWGYDDTVDYEKIGRFIAAGLDTFVCPGTSGWKRIINAMDHAECNLAAFAAAGREHGATGLLNTDWGDHGHFNPLACSWHGIALGAALGWRADHPTGTDFDERFARVALGKDDPSGVALLRKASRIADRCETWRMLSAPLESVCDDSTLPDREHMESARQSARELHTWCERMIAVGGGDVRDLTELAVAARFMELFAEKMAIARQVTSSAEDSGSLRNQRRAWAEELSAAAAVYADCWRTRNKPSGLDDVLRALSVAAQDVRG